MCKEEKIPYYTHDKERQKISFFISRYLNIIQHLIKDKKDIDSQVLKVLDYKEELEERCVDNEWPNSDKLTMSVRKLFKDLYDSNSYKTDENILKFLGVNEKPEFVLFDKIEQQPARKYVLAFFVDYDSEDDLYGHSRNNGQGERFYGSGNANTKEEFIEEIKASYKDCWWTELQSVGEVQEEPECTLYYYMGYIYKYEKEKN